MEYGKISVRNPEKAKLFGKTVNLNEYFDGFKNREIKYAVAFILKIKGKTYRFVYRRRHCNYKTIDEAVNKANKLIKKLQDNEKIDFGTLRKGNSKRFFGIKSIEQVYVVKGAMSKNKFCYDYCTVGSFDIGTWYDYQKYRSENNEQDK